MKTSSAGKVLDRTRARNSFFINQLATPGLGSLMAGRYLAGLGQLALAVIGFCLVLIWFALLMIQVYHSLDTAEPPKSPAWPAKLGAVFFGASWVWSLFTSLELLREAKANEASQQRTSHESGPHSL